MTHDSEYFRRRAAEARAACHKQPCESTEVAGDLALAFSALARRHAARAAAATAASAAAISPALLVEDA